MCYELVAVSSVVLPMMYYCINLTLVNFSKFLDGIGATQLASVSGRSRHLSMSVTVVLQGKQHLYFI